MVECVASATSATACPSNTFPTRALRALKPIAAWLFLATRWYTIA